MTTGMHTIIYPVKNLAGAKAMFGRLLGVTPAMDEPYYVHFSAGGQEIGLDPHGHAHGMAGPVGSWHVDDLHATLDELLAAGAETEQPVRDVGGGKLTATVRDTDGNVIGLLQR